MTETTTVIVDTTTAADDHPGDHLVRRGRWCVAAALVGFAQGAAVLAWPHQVDAARYSYPFTASWYVVAQATFFLQHLPLLVAVAAVAALPAVRQEQAAHRALVVAAAGLGLLALLELVAMSAASTPEVSNLGAAVNSLYAIPVLLTGVGLLVAAVVLLRRHTLDRHPLGRGLPWTLLALGAFVFIGLTPAISTDSFVGGRVAIMAWMLLFALLGRVLQRPAR